MSRSRIAVTKPSTAGMPLKRWMKFRVWLFAKLVRLADWVLPYDIAQITFEDSEEPT